MFGAFFRGVYLLVDQELEMAGENFVFILNIHSDCDDVFVLGKLHPESIVVFPLRVHDLLGLRLSVVEFK